MYIIGSLYAALQDICSKQYEVALLVIDVEDYAAEIEIEIGFEYGFEYEISNTPGNILAHSNTTARQQRLLMYMQSLGCAVFSISHRRGLPVLNESYDVTRTALRALYNGHEYRLRKPTYNAFERTNLKTRLNSLRISHVVVMGWRAEICVPHTIGVSGIKADMGAIHHGFSVMTCAQILHGNSSNWALYNSKRSHNLKFYSKF
ncbi:MAG: isochorismatase family protein [Psychromonas sp.]|nr:isochorismatase family protein [Psychromonas sp.]